jgi:hypothetical protein
MVMVMEVMFSQPTKARLPIFVTPAFITTVLIFGQSPLQGGLFE